VKLRLPAGAAEGVVRHDVDALAPGMRVLLAEDNVVNQKVALMQLRRLGCVVDVACHGGEAVRMASENEYDLILMDLQMPVMDGLAASRAIRATEAGSRTPIVALTANAFAEHRQLSADAGMDGHLSKPFRADELRAVVVTFGPRNLSQE
jgi:CheY-like chemotaxis protein